MFKNILAEIKRFYSLEYAPLSHFLKENTRVISKYVRGFSNKFLFP